MLRSILVPLDGSSFGEHVLPFACALARKADAVLHLAHVHQPIPPTTVAGVAIMDSLELHRRQDEQAYLSDVSRRLTATGPVRLELKLLEGDIVAALREYARARDIGLMALSTHGRGALSRFWLGSVADQVVREAELPLLIYRPQDGAADFARAFDLKRILVPLDGSPLAEQILEPAVSFAALFGAELLLAQVVQPVLRPVYAPDGSTAVALAHSGELENIPALQERLVDEARTYLLRLAASLRGRGARVDTTVVVEEQPAVGLLREAQAKRAGLIAMETHARRGLARLFLGSVADKVVRAGAVPVLLGRGR